MPIMNVTQEASGVSGPVVQYVGGREEPELPVCSHCGNDRYYTVLPLRRWANFGRDGRLLNPHGGFLCTECDTKIGPLETK